MTGTLSIIIPTRNAAPGLGATLESVRGAKLGPEVIVVDGGSTDTTQDLAREAGARIIASAPGRGPQLAQGAGAAAADWLLFLHADTRLDPGWADEVARYISTPSNQERAACFRFSLDDSSRAARRLEYMVALRARVFGLAYGDQGLLISRSMYRRIGGFRPLVLMEDVDLIRRVGRRNLDVLKTRAVTSARRYRESGYLLRSTRNLFCLSLYFLGVPPTFIARIYR